MADEVVVIGAGGFGREALDVAQAVRDADGRPVWHVAGVVDDAPSSVNLERLDSRGIPFLGTMDSLLNDREPSAYVIGIGSPWTRKRIAERLDDAGWIAAKALVHPAATLGSDVRVGAGTVICAGARLTTNIRVGRHVHINPNATIGHDTTISGFVSINPAAAISGDCTISELVLVGAQALVLNQLTVGENVTIGGAACVVRDVEPGAVVKGVPAR